MSHFQYLSRSIVYQMLSGKAAATIFARFAALTPGRSFPKPVEVLALSDTVLRGCGLSGSKVAALRTLAGAVESGELRLAGLARRPDDEVVRALSALRGIGPWTAQMFLMFRLGRLDVMPELDLGVQEGVRRLDGLDARPTPRELRARSECWRPLRSVGSWMMWRLADEDR
jgi:DNA-3-methyladenine glycosylase II